MLDAYIIKRIEEEKEKNKKQRPALRIRTQLPDYRKVEECQEQPSNRGIAVIDFSI